MSRQVNLIIMSVKSFENQSKAFQTSESQNNPMMLLGGFRTLRESIGSISGAKTGRSFVMSRIPDCEKDGVK
jgi:hypothetical protein